jgi:cell division protein ZapE
MGASLRPSGAKLNRAAAIESIHAEGEVRVSGKVGAAYEALVASGAIERDAAQIAAVARLDALAAALETPPSRGPMARFFGPRQPPAPGGLYLWGEVGRGKTMLMDLFFDGLAVEAKRRIHFHAFMAEVHERVHAHRQRVKRGETAQADPIPPVARGIREEARVLCFDEFAVADIADAMILGRLFTALFELGVTLVATSNVAPERLYEGGLQRANFLPFVDLLARRVEVVRLAARADFRLEKLDGHAVWYAPLGTEADQALDAAWRRISGGVERATALTVTGRRLDVPRAGVGSARMSFAELCGRPLGAADYLALTRAFHTFVVDRIPAMDFEQRNEARRFITFIDAAYDHGVKLVASAAAEPDRLYVATEGKEAFEFRRTASRLVEMRSLDYLRGPHVVAGEGSFVPIET